MNSLELVGLIAVLWAVCGPAFLLAIFAIVDDEDFESWPIWLVYLVLFLAGPLYWFGMALYNID